MRATDRSPIVTSIPGRLRMRDARLRNVRLADALAEGLATIPGVSDIAPANATGSVLVRYDPGVCARESFEQQAVAAFQALFADTPGKAPAPTPRSGPYRWQQERRWNRVAKWGMLISLPLSLALAAGGSRRLHVATGGLFSLLLLVHLYVHQRHLLK